MRLVGNISVKIRYFGISFDQQKCFHVKWHLEILGFIQNHLKKKPWGTRKWGRKSISRDAAHVAISYRIEFE